MDPTLWTKAALRAGATKAAVIDNEQIIMDKSFYEICEHGNCGSFGLCYACPPDIGPVEENMKRIRTFRHGLLYQTIGQIEDSYDIEGMADVSRKHAGIGVKLRREVAKFYTDETLQLSCGGCHLCEKCLKRDNNKPCRHPDLVMPAMEGMGIDVYRTTSSTDLKYINGSNTVTYFGLVLFDKD